jgi:uncharacterized membrane protein YgdD (TMEM256/DUF423 family)
MAGTAYLDRKDLWHPALRIALAGWVAGGFLFAGDIASRALAGHRLFAMAAPTGGTLLIAAWAALIVSAIGAMLRR